MKSRTMYLSSLVIAVGLFLICGRTAHAITIAEQGQPRATIVAVEDLTLPERHAVEELALFLGQVTGAEIPITDRLPDGPNRILVGEPSARLVVPDFSVSDLGEEGLIIRTVGDDLILAGGRPRGTLYAVYTFLEDHVGCRWWAPGASDIPNRPTLSFQEIDYRYVPPLEYRESFWTTAFDQDWSVRNKNYGLFAKNDERRGGHYEIVGFVHTFYTLIPPDRYFADHPEWFSEIDGQRIADRGQLCLSNEPMRAELVKNLRELLRQHPNARQTSVSQNDWENYCRCAECSAIDEEEGSPAGSILRFVNAVAAEIEEEFPNVAVSTLAYMPRYSEKPPKITRPRDNVIVWLCTMNASYNLPLKTHARNATFAENLVGWGKIADRLYIWDYVTNFRHYLFVHPNLWVLGPNVQFFVENNVVGIFEQGAYQGPGAEMMELRAWVLAKLLWDPTLDGRELIKTFCHGYYGAGGEHVLRYIRTIHSIMQQHGQPLGCYEEPDRAFMNIETLSEGWAHLKAAEEAVRDDPVLLARVRAVQMPMRYAFLIRWDDMRAEAEQKQVDWPLPEDRWVVFDELKSWATEIGVTHISESIFVGSHEGVEQLADKLKMPPRP